MKSARLVMYLFTYTPAATEPPMYSATISQSY